MKPTKKQDTYLLHGIHPVSAALKNPRREIRKILVTKPALEKLESLLRARNITPQIVLPHDINKLLPEHAVHQGVVMEVKPMQELSLENFLAPPHTHKPVLVLDQVTDPHNVGAILRSAAAFDAGAVIVAKDNAASETAVLAKASSGALEIIPMISVTNISHAMELLKKAGYWCVGLDGEARQTLVDAKLNQKTALILGAEGKGMRRLTAERCDLVVRLPISPQMESLNVSNAASIALYSLFVAK